MTSANAGLVEKTGGPYLKDMIRSDLDEFAAGAFGSGVRAVKGAAVCAGSSGACGRAARGVDAGRSCGRPDAPAVSFDHLISAGNQ